MTLVKYKKLLGGTLILVIAVAVLLFFVVYMGSRSTPENTAETNPGLNPAINENNNDVIETSEEEPVEESKVTPEPTLTEEEAKYNYTVAVYAGTLTDPQLGSEYYVFRSCLTPKNCQSYLVSQAAVDNVATFQNTVGMKYYLDIQDLQSKMINGLDYKLLSNNFIIYTPVLYKTNSELSSDHFSLTSCNESGSICSVYLVPKTNPYYEPLVRVDQSENQVLVYSKTLESRGVSKGVNYYKLGTEHQIDVDAK